MKLLEILFALGLVFVHSSDTDLLSAARNWKGQMAWAGGGKMNPNYELMEFGKETYLSSFGNSVWIPSNFAAFVNGDSADASILLESNASMCCWQFVQTVLAQNDVNDWSMEALFANEASSLTRARQIDTWLLQWNITAWSSNPGVQAAENTSFFAAIAYLGMTVAMLGEGVESTTWYSDDQGFVGEACPPASSIVSFGYTSHYLVSAGGPSSNDSSIAYNPMECRFVHLFHGGCTDSLDCWGSDYLSPNVCDPDLLGAPCNTTHVYESDLLYLQSVTAQWAANEGSQSTINFMSPRPGTPGLNNSEAAQSWRNIAKINEVAWTNGPVGAGYGLGKEYTSARYLLQQLYENGAVPGEVLSGAGISAEQLEADPSLVDVEAALSVIADYFETAMSVSPN